MKRNCVSHCQLGTADKVYIYSIRRGADGAYTIVGKWGRRGQTTLQSQVKGSYRSESDALAEMRRLHAKRVSTKGYVDVEGDDYEGPVRVTDRAIQANLEAEEGSEPGELLDILPGERYAILSKSGNRRYVNGPASIALKAGEKASKGSCTCGNDTFETVMDNVAKPSRLRCKSCKKVWMLDGKAATREGYDPDVVVCRDNTGMEDRFDEGVEYVREKHEADDMVYVYDKFGVKQECFADRFEEQDPYEYAEDAHVQIFSGKPDNKRRTVSAIREQVR